MKVKIPPQAKIQAVAGTGRAGLLLRRICYWHHKTKITVSGRDTLWMCKTRAEWAEDAGLTTDQVKRALVDLRERGVIVTERHLFKGKLPNFLHLTADALQALGMVPRCTIQTVQSCTVVGAEPHHSDGAELHCSKESEVRKGDRKGGTTASEAEAEMRKSVDEIVGEHEAARGERFTPEALEKLTEGPATIANLQEIWRCAHVLYRPEKPGTFTTKEKAWLNGIKDIDDLPALLAVIVREWSSFTDYAKDALGWKAAPARPQVLFIQQHASIADDWFTGFAAQALAHLGPGVSETSQGW